MKFAQLRQILIGSGIAVYREFESQRGKVRAYHERVCEGTYTLFFFDHPDIKNFKILYFASAKEAAGVVSELIPLDTEEMSIPQLFEKLEASHPNLKKKKILSSVAVAVNLEYVEIASGKIRVGDEVAIIPPVSGG